MKQTYNSLALVMVLMLTGFTSICRTPLSAESLEPLLSGMPLLRSAEITSSAPKLQPELTCAVSTNVTNPPADITIAWDPASGQYEGEKSENGQYNVITLTATIRNTGTEQARRVRAALLLSEMFVLEEGETAIKAVDPNDLDVGSIVQVRWTIRPMGLDDCSAKEREFRVLITSENSDPTECVLRVLIAERPCIVSLDLPDNIIGVTGQIISVPVQFKSNSSNNIERYRIMLEYDPALLRFHDVLAEGSRTDSGWRGPSAELLARTGASEPDVVLVKDQILNLPSRIVFGEEGVLVYIRFEVAFNPVFSESSQTHVTQSRLELLSTETFDVDRLVRMGFNGATESDYGNVSIIMEAGTVTVTSPCAWPLEVTGTLGGNRPNPFNPSTTIHYELLRDAEIRLVVLDMFGREVRVLAEGAQRAGEHEMVFHAEDLPSGMYFYQLRTSSGVETRRMLLLR